jgi:DNA-binding transcriptional LysR family regulator
MRVEIRQLRFFVTLAEELHFGRAAAREHIVQSALSQQIQRLERELGVALVERNTHHVRLTAAGRALLTEARAVLRSVERAVIAAQAASAETEVLRVSVLDASLDSMPQVLRNVQYNHPRLVVHRMEVSVPAQYRMLAERSLDVGVGNPVSAPAGVASELFRLDPLGVLVHDGHPLADLEAVPVGALVNVPLVLAEDARAPEFNSFVTGLCEAAGFRASRFHGSVQSVRAAADLVAQGVGVAVVPQSCDVVMPGVRWLPLEPEACYPWSLLWREGDESRSVRVVRESARALSRKHGWLAAARRPA